jgi:hypothetical protein
VFSLLSITQRWKKSTGVGGDIFKKDLEERFFRNVIRIVRVHPIVARSGQLSNRLMMGLLDFSGLPGFGSKRESKS